MLIFIQDHFQMILIEAIVVLFIGLLLTVTHHHFDKDIYGFCWWFWNASCNQHWFTTKYILNDKESVLFTKCRLVFLEPRWNLQLKFIRYKRFMISTEDERCYETLNISKVIYQSFEKHHHTLNNHFLVLEQCLWLN